MPKSTEDISLQDAQHVIYVFDKSAPGGLEPGSFSTLLIQTIMSADMGNRRKLAEVFPGLVKAVDMIQNDRDGMQALQNIAAFTPAPGTWTNGGLTFKTCPGCKGQNSRDFDDRGNVSSWCGGCDGEGKVLVK